MSENFDVNHIETAFRAGAAFTRVRNVADHPLAVVPEGYKLHDLERMLPFPLRRKGTVHMDDADSFCRFVESYMTDKERTVMFSDIDSRSFRAVLNYHAAGNIEETAELNGWSDFGAVLNLTNSDQWRTWKRNDGVRMGQLEFADFIEDNLGDISSPAGADIMDMISALKVKRKAEFHSVVDTATGMKSLQFSEETRGETIKGNIDLFGKFTLGISPIQGSELVQVGCRLRFNITENNKLRVFYSIINPEAVERAVFNAEKKRIEERMRAMGVLVFAGSVD